MSYVCRKHQAQCTYLRFNSNVKGAANSTNTSPRCMLKTLVRLCGSCNVCCVTFVNGVWNEMLVQDESNKTATEPQFVVVF